MPLKINVKCMNKYPYVIMNKYSFINIINLEATRKLFLQLFSKIEKIFSTCLFSQNILTLTIERQTSDWN